MIWRSHGVGKLEPVCVHSGNIIALYLQAMGEHVLVGDLMRSASLLRYKAGEHMLEEVARDLSSAWLTATAMISESLFLCADDSHNLFTLHRGAAPQAALPTGPPGA